MDKGDVVRYFFQILHNVGGHKDTVGFILDKVQKNIQDFISYDWIQPACRLIQDQKLCLVGKSHGDGQLHLHTAGVGLQLHLFFQAEFVKVGKKGWLLPVGIDTGHHAADFDAVHILGKVRLAQDYPQAFLNGFLFFQVVHSQNLYAPVFPVKHIQNELDCGAFPRAIFTDKAHDAAAGNRQ